MKTERFRILQDRDALGNLSVAIPFHVVNEMLFRAISSVLSDLRAGDELILVDDTHEGSDDFSSLIATKSVFESPAIRILRNSKKGIVSARNLAVASSQHELISFLDSDDEWITGRRDRHVKAMIRNPEAPGIAGRVLYQCAHRTIIGRSGELAPPPRLREISRFFPRVRTSGLTVRKGLAMAAGGFVESERLCEDYGAWLRLQSANGPMLVDAQPAARYTLHPGQVSKSLGSAAAISAAALSQEALSLAAKASESPELRRMLESVSRSGLTSFLLTGRKPNLSGVFRDVNRTCLEMAFWLIATAIAWDRRRCPECESRTQ